MRIVSSCRSTTDAGCWLIADTSDNDEDEDNKDNDDDICSVESDLTLNMVRLMLLSKKSWMQSIHRLIHDGYDYDY